MQTNTDLISPIRSTLALGKLLSGKILTALLKFLTWSLGVVSRTLFKLSSFVGLTVLPFSTEGWDHLPKGMYDYVPKGKYVFGPAKDFLLVPKNRYKVQLLPNMKRSADHGVGWITEDNAPKSYDELWGDATNLQAFRVESDHVRDKLTLEIVDHVSAYIKQDARILDVGCGVGDLLAQIRRHEPSVDVYGLDFSKKGLNVARSGLANGKFVLYTIDKTLPFKEGAFDVVLCTDVIEHLEYPDHVVTELVRICKRGGVVAIVVPDGDVDQFLGHYWFWDQDSLASLLARWDATVVRLPKTLEFLGLIFVRENDKI